jgi:hypothetical protein
LGGSPTPWQGGMWIIDCPGERRVRENRMHGVGGGGRNRADDAQPYRDRWVACRWRASRLPHNTWRTGDRELRVEGGAVRASLHHEAKPDAIKGPSRKRGGCARKVAGLTLGGLHGCPGMPGRAWRDRRVGWDGGVREGAARRGEVSRGRSTGGIDCRREGPNAKPRRRTPVLAGWTLKAANPARGLGVYMGA